VAAQGDAGREMPDELVRTLTVLDDLLFRLATDQPLAALTAIGRLETLIEMQAPRAGIAARGQSATWTEIGEALSATRQAAFQRFNRHLPRDA
jgi:hypothetical protein